MKYYFLGIGGVSMSALAIILKMSGEVVSGYDEKRSRGTENLTQHNIEVDFVLNKKHMKESDVIVFSSAFKSGNRIFDFAKSLNKKMICRGELLGQIAGRYEKVIAVAGAHGKTTTTAMIYQILMCAGKNPTLHLGGFLSDNKQNYFIGGSEYFVTEACEYYDNFLYLFPHLSVVTNIEKEHMDYFKTFENEKKSFDKFKNQSRIVVDSFEGCCAKHIKHNKDGYLSFNLYQNKSKIMRLNLKICEEINVQNCIYAYLACKKLGIEDWVIKFGLERFYGVDLRFQKAKSSFFENVVLDYAHHPTEILKTLESAKKIYKNKKIFVIFQPHTYSRTKTLFEEFLNVFDYVEYPIFYKTYSARELPQDGVSSKELYEIIKKNNKNAHYFENFLDLSRFFKNFASKQNVLIFVGAGDLPEILHKNGFIS